MPWCSLAWVDYLVMAVYFGFTVGIGYAVKRSVQTSTDFFLAGRSMPTWVAGSRLSPRI